MSWNDEDDWVGTPPEGRYTRDRAKPEFWWSQRSVRLAAAGGFAAALLALAIVLAVR